MKLSVARGHYYRHSTAASAVARQLAFAGIAVIWIFKTTAMQVPSSLRLPLFLMIIVLALDLLQYFSLSFVWGLVPWRKEQMLRNDTELDKDPSIVIPKWINGPGVVFFWAKLAMVIVAYTYLFVRIFPLIFPSS